MSILVFPTRVLSLAIGAGALLFAACDSGELSAPPESPAIALTPVDLSASLTKIDVCHRTTTGDYTEISIADAAYDTHLEHGDAAIGDPYPAMTGYIFGYECEPVSSTPVCPCYETGTDLGPLWWSGAIYTYEGTDDEWLATLSKDTDFASASFDGQYGACEIQTADRVQTVSRIREEDAAECHALLNGAGLIVE